MRAYKPQYLAIAAVILICLSGLLVYSNTFHATFHFDDEESIIRNVAIRHLFDLKAVWDFWPTRFVTYISFALNYRLGQLDVFGYHVFNLIIHLGAALFAWWLALLTFSTPALKDDKI
ncbi:MAG: tetratricopeptide repeat protein, partial [Candidatus Omnitrophica bacterium]|nr:tetratricopeptide repeat protein [Candidatus Omnitrophota bacterium]